MSDAGRSLLKTGGGASLFGGLARHAIGRTILKLTAARVGFPVFPSDLQEVEEERVRREFEAQMEAVSQLDLLQKDERAR